MNRRRVLALGRASVVGLFAMLGGPAVAVRLPVSKVTVNVLSVSRESFKALQYANGLFETTVFSARARIEQVLENDHDLKPGDIIQIRYETHVRNPPLRRVPPPRHLKVGETVTITIFGNGKNFTWRS
jgi:hypothetical protein